jgi:hypothetical protein
MEGFTKEELDTILICYEDSAYWINKDHDPIYNKLKSMIDNYCDHDWESYVSPDGHILRCFKCLKEIPE